MKNKGLIAFTTILFLLSASAGTVGYLENKNKEIEPNNEVKNEIKYRYFLEDLEVDSMPKNETTTNENGEEVQNIIYALSSFKCTNEITGTFDTEKWEFIPSVNKNGECSLYFVNTQYEVILTTINAEQDESNLRFINRESDGVFKINPNEGYEFNDNYVCTDGKEGQWDPANNTFTINAITSDIACKLTFEIKNLNMDVTVTNGNGNTTETAKYGESISAIIEPNDGYGNPKIECTNNQTAKFVDNQLVIDKITSDTSCKVKFLLLPIEKYKLTIDNIPENVTIVNGSDVQEIEKGKTGTIILKANEGYEISNISCEGITPNKETLEDGSIKYSFLSVTKNITCTVETKGVE